jgi:hypothetical protein
MGNFPLEWSCPTGIEILRRLTEENCLILGPDGWSFHRSDRFLPNPVGFADVEWLQEDGLAIPLDAGRRIVASHDGFTLIESIDRSIRALMSNDDERRKYLRHYEACGKPESHEA